MSRTLPFTSSDTIKIFRHAISLDEHRSKYNVVHWQPSGESLCPDPTRTESDIEGVIEMWFAGVHSGTFDVTRLQLRKCAFQWTYSTTALISDVGGSAVKDEEPHSLGHVTFRWMMQEIDRSGCGILFDYHAIRELGIPPDCVPLPSTKQDPATPGLHSIIPIPAPAPDNTSSTSSPNSSSQRASPHNIEGGFMSSLRTPKHKVKTSMRNGNVQAKETLPEQASKPCGDLDAIDVLEPIHDQMVANPLWWLLQTPVWHPGERMCVSLLRTTPVLLIASTILARSLLTTGFPSYCTRPDFIVRRRFPTDEAQRSHQRIHHSVALRMDRKAPGVVPYVPRARLPENWRDLLAS
jgi:hypothetical protein